MNTGNTNRPSPAGRRYATLLTYFLSFFGMMMLLGIYRFRHWFFVLLALVSLYWAYRFSRIAK